LFLEQQQTPILLNMRKGIFGASRNKARTAVCILQLAGLSILQSSV